MTISLALKLASARLKAGKINIPPLEAEILLAAVLKKPPVFLLTRGEKKITKTQNAKYRRLIARRLKGEPVAYLTGHKEFYGLNFKVNKNVLIPRPETELMVEEALKLITRNPQPVTLIDVGTGSGCIIITLAKSIKNYRPEADQPWADELSPFAKASEDKKITNYDFLATDISNGALKVAKQNSRLHDVNKNIKFIQGNLLEPILNSKFLIRSASRRTKFVILCNLPYGWKAWKNNCSLDTAGLKFEPQIALFTDNHGLGLYKNYSNKSVCYAIRDTRYAILMCYANLTPGKPRKLNSSSSKNCPAPNTK